VPNGEVRGLGASGREVGTMGFKHRRKVNFAGRYVSRL